MKIKIIKFDNFYQAPCRKHYDDAGADCYSPEDVIIKAHETYAINLGFGTEIPNGYTGFIHPRSSLSKLGIITQLSPIDSSYRGPIHAIITNQSNHDYEIKRGDRIGQLVIVPVVICDFVDDLGEARGAGWNGSTGK